MDKKIFRPQRRIEKRYAAAINTILKGLYRHLNGARSPFQMLEVIRGFARSPTMNKAAKEAAQAMVTNLLKDGAGGRRQAARRGVIFHKMSPEKRHRATLEMLQ